MTYKNVLVTHRKLVTSSFQRVKLDFCSFLGFGDIDRNVEELRIQFSQKWTVTQIGCLEILQKDAYLQLFSVFQLKSHQT